MSPPHALSCFNSSSDPKLTTGRIAFKIIRQPDDEVMKVYSV
jgi:hypothetical protein